MTATASGFDFASDGSQDTPCLNTHTTHEIGFFFNLPRDIQEAGAQAHLPAPIYGPDTTVQELVNVCFGAWIVCTDDCDFRTTKCGGSMTWYEGGGKAGVKGVTAQPDDWKRVLEEMINETYMRVGRGGPLARYTK